MKRSLWLFIAVVIIGAAFAHAFRGNATVYSDSNLFSRSTPKPLFLGAPADWINTNGKAVSSSQLAGHPVLVDFWEYTCVNCLRTLPYIKAWQARYAKEGLIIVGIHTPEFAFAKDSDNVAAAVKNLGITWPVLVDSNYKNWTAWQGSSGYWPRKFLIDSRANVVYDHAGEGGYGDTETKIQELIRAYNPKVKLPAILAPIRGEDKPGAVCYPVTPEMYAGERGYQQGQVAIVGAFRVGATVDFRAPASLEDGVFYPQGAWQTNSESLRRARETKSLSDYVTVKYHAITANAVIKPEDGASFRLYVWQDGKPVAKQDAGEDILTAPDGSTFTQVDSPRMYRLTKNARFGVHTLRMAADSTAFGLYSMTFTSCEAPGPP